MIADIDKYRVVAYRVARVAVGVIATLGAVYLAIQTGDPSHLDRVECPPCECDAGAVE